MSVSAVSTKGAPFPVKFDNPVDSTVTYTFDPMQFPAPISPLFQSVISAAFTHGITDAAASLKLPLAAAKVTIQNNYLFSAFVPILPANKEEARALGERAEASLQSEIPLLMERWEKEFQPRLKANLDRLATMNLNTVNRKAIPFLLDEVVAIAKDTCSIHFRIVAPILTAMQLYDELHADLFGGEEQDAHKLLVGLPSESVQAGVGLSDLAGAAKVAGLDQLILSVPADQVMAALEAAPIGKYYIAAIRDYLHQYGLRQDLFDFTVPTWQEDPTIAIANIQVYLRTGYDARAEHARSLKAAVKALNEARAQLEAYPRAVREQFESMVASARTAHFLQEEHNFYIDQQSQALTRLLFMRLGERLVQSGALAKSDDIFMLSLDELKLVASNVLSEEQIGDVRMLVLEKEADLERSAEMAPPPFVGAAPDGPAPPDSTIGHAMLRFFAAPPRTADAPN